MGALPGQYAESAEWRHALGLSLVDAIAALGRVDPTAVGLSDFGCFWKQFRNNQGPGGLGAPGPGHPCTRRPGYFLRCTGRLPL